MAKRKQKTFEEVVYKHLKTPKSRIIVKNEKILEEAYLPLTPFIAYTSLKKAVFNSLRKNKFVDMAKEIGKFPVKVKARAASEVEKIRAGLGISSDGTVYKLTQKQIDVMSDIYDKYGKELVDEILEFRRKILAPYQVIKRTIKKSGRISSKDITGLSREEFKSVLESGRKKILARGKEYFEKSQELQDKVADINSQFEDLRKAKSEFNKENPNINYNIVNKIYKEYDLSGERYEGYSREELSKVYNEIIKNYKSLVKTADEEKLSSIGWEKAKKIIQRNRDLWKGKTIDLTKTEKDELYSRGDFNVALGKYFFSREILKQLAAPGIANIFKQTYLSIIDEMMDKLEERKEKAIQSLIAQRKNTQFTEKEKKVWGRLPTASKFSGDLDDYYQKVREEDFLDKPITIPRSEKLINAEKKIENEIRRFERKLKSIMTKQDFDKLKNYRLINNLITTKELRASENMFKSKSDIVDEFGEKEIEKETGKEYINSSEYYRRLKEIATSEYDTISELNNAKKEAEELTDKVKKQGDEDLVKEYEDILHQIRRRRNTEKNEIIGHKTETGGIIDVDDIEKLAKSILNTEYTSTDKIKQDRERLNNLINKYKETDKEDSEKNIEDIQFLLDRVNRKLTTEKSRLE
jgi:nucleoside-triphosphatase THEP1